MACSERVVSTDDGKGADRAGAQHLRALPDVRKGGPNQRYALQDAALSAFAVFFTQSPSFLDYQVRMQKDKGRNNASALFGVHQIPSDPQIRNLLDPVNPISLYTSPARDEVS